MPLKLFTVHISDHDWIEDRRTADYTIAANNKDEALDLAIAEQKERHSPIHDWEGPECEEMGSTAEISISYIGESQIPHIINCRSD